MIERGSAVPVTRQAELLGLSRSSVYYTPRPVSERDLLEGALGKFPGLSAPR